MRYWVFTSKPSHFRLEEALQPGATLDWPTFSRFKFEVGDLVFIYASNPVMQLVGMLEIERNDLDFSEVDPRNDLRKWPKLYSKIPWLRLRVIQRAPVPFKPLQRRSLYYHTEFKPSPYPKLLHDGEIDYVLRAFEEIKTYNDMKDMNEEALSQAALDRTTNGNILAEAADLLPGAGIADINYSKAESRLVVTITLNALSDNLLRLTFEGIERVVWAHDKGEDTMAGIRLTLEDTFILTIFEGCGFEILARSLSVDRG